MVKNCSVPPAAPQCLAVHDVLLAEALVDAVEHGVDPPAPSNAFARCDQEAQSTLEVWQAGQGPAMSYVIEESIPWLAVSPAEGTSAGEGGMRRGDVIVAFGHFADHMQPRPVLAVNELPPFAGFGEQFPAFGALQNIEMQFITGGAVLLPEYHQQVFVGFQRGIQIID